MSSLTSLEAGVLHPARVLGVNRKPMGAKGVSEQEDKVILWEAHGEREQLHTT